MMILMQFIVCLMFSMAWLGVSADLDLSVVERRENQRIFPQRKSIEFNLPGSGSEDNVLIDVVSSGSRVDGRATILFNGSSVVYDGAPVLNCVALVDWGETAVVYYGTQYGKSGERVVHDYALEVPFYFGERLDLIPSKINTYPKLIIRLKSSMITGVELWVSKSAASNRVLKENEVCFSLERDRFEIKALEN